MKEKKDITSEKKSIRACSRKKVDTSKALLKAADIISSMMGITDILKALSEIARELLKCDCCVTFIWNEEEKVFRPGESSGLEPEKEIIFKSLRIKPDDMPAFSMIIEGKDIVVQDVRKGSFFSHRMIDLFNIKSVLYTPIIIRNKLLGSLMIVYKKTHRFTQRDSELAHGIAHYTAFALNNALLVSEIKELLIHTIIALASAIDAKSPWTQGHSERVSDLIVAIGTEMGMPEEEIENLRLAGLLHDVGKLGVSETILNKPERLTEEEFNIVKKHPLIGAEILSSIKQLRSMLPAVESHHERYDGKGYPRGLKGKEIPLVGRILAVADAYESMTAARPYRGPRSREEILNELIENKGKQFDPEIVDIFLKILKDSNYSL
jgi:putative nucleotidyltransferase with HDIG domain